MRRQTLVLPLLLGLACGDVEEKAACRSSVDCPAGERCASAEGEQRCWPDAVAPVTSGVTLSCGTTPCLRDGTLRVEATVADDHEVLSAEAALSLEPARPIPLSRAGSRWVADVPLRDFPFERFEGPVTATVTGVDGAKTRSAPVQSAGVQVTRLRWEYDAPNALTSPAVMADGTVVVGVASTSEQLLAVRADGTKAWALTVGAQAVTATPAVGSHGIWVAGQDGLLSAVALDGSAVLPGGTVQSDGAIDGAVAITTLADEQWGLAASRSGRMVAVNGAGTTARSPAGLATLFGPVITTSGRVCSVTTILSCFPFDGAFGAPSTANLGAGVSGALVAGASDVVWTLTAPPGTVSRTGSTGGPVPVASLPATTFSDSLVILAGGDLVFGDVEHRLHRFGPDGTVRWPIPPALTGIPTAPLVMIPNVDGMFVVSTSSGSLVVLDDDGRNSWEAALGSAALRAPNIYTPPGQPAGKVLSTAYVSSASGKLYAVIVDGELDTSAPWPKAFHDPRNTNNAGTQP